MSDALRAEMLRVLKAVHDGDTPEALVDYALALLPDTEGEEPVAWKQEIFDGLRETFGDPDPEGVGFRTAERIIWTELDYAAQTRRVSPERSKAAARLVLDALVRHIAATTPQRDKLPKLADLWGSAPNLTGGLGAVEFVRRQRARDDKLREALVKIAAEQGWGSGGNGTYTVCTDCGNDREYGCESDCVYEIARTALSENPQDTERQSADRDT